MLRSITTLLGLALLGACSVVGIRSGYEQPRFEVVARLDDATEVRRYPPRLAAEAVLEAADRDAAFRLLFDYISGANQADQRIAMTAPVAADTPSGDAPSERIAMTVPVESRTAGSEPTTMRFFLPASYTAESVPQPTDPRVRIVTLPEQTFAVRRFSGRWTDSALAEQETALRRGLDGFSWRPSGPASTLFYDPPWTLPFLRRNEIAIPVDST